MPATRQERTRFRSRLARFKRTGCNLLIVGDRDVATRRAASRRLFGAPDEERYRLLVSTGDDDPESWLPASGTVVSADCPTRGDGDGTPDDADASDPADADASGPDDADVSEDPVALAGPEAIDDRLPDRSFEPGELRVGVTDLSPFLGDPARTDAVFELAEAVLDGNGIGHYHYPGPSADAVPDRLVDAFDATVELRRTADGPEQRWHVPDESLTTDWIPVDADA